ncbi:MAG: rod shape-determining protein MreC [Novosphingobium sp.]
MAPSPKRRPGYSRRAQYSSFAGYIVGLLGALAGAVLLVVSIINPAVFAGVRGLASDAAAPAGKASSGLRQGGQGIFAVLKGYALAGIRDARLERELRSATVRLAEARAVADENRRLKALLGLASEDPGPVAVTRLTASTPASTRRFATAAAGSAQGVGVGMPVRSPLGLIGRVLEVGGTTSRVLLVTDSESLVPVRRASDGIAAFAQGRGDGALQLRLINLGVNPLRGGDIFVTSGSGGLYRPGTPLAVVTSLTRDGAVARVLSDPAATDYVVIDQIWSAPAPVAPASPAAAAP